LIAKRDRKTKIVAFSLWKYAVAATVILALSIFYVGFSANNRQEYATTFGEVKEVILPDGSIATLNSLSTLSFDVDTW
tara:strand:+ start:1824 stop:2057 length:234 start_codon:yes stop_codon:yes gene_type:complete